MIYVGFVKPNAVLHVLLEQSAWRLYFIAKYVRVCLHVFPILFPSKNAVLCPFCNVLSSMTKKMMLIYKAMPLGHGIL